MANHHLMDKFIDTYDPSMAVDAGIGIVLFAAGYIILWSGITRGSVDTRKFWITLLVVAVAILSIRPDSVFEVGMLLRGMFLGSMPAIGWMSFLGLVVLGSMWVGAQWMKNHGAPVAQPQTIHTQPEPRQAVTREQPRAAVSNASARAWPLPKPRASQEPVRLTLAEAPPAVPLAYRRETMPVVRNRRK